ncbi:MFS transporter [Cellvibrio sp. NN19]|uniref:MFS transporter n=1 Tax=Cellvibrio chitinivorans TaxID=3102792 RepID=UPI002B411B92|nr:MFS transporter [Cellvibrio sp. NN19]
MSSLDTAIDNTPVTTSPTHWGGVFAMSLCVFALIASEFMPVSLLTPLAADLHVSEGFIGQGIAISGAFAVITSLLITRLAGNLDRKQLLLGMTALMGVSGAVIAMAPDYSIYMFGRALIGVVVGGFWSMSAATAMRLVPSDDVPRALTIFNSGNALATVIAAPLGAWLGAVVGWRGAFFCLVPVALVAFAWQWFSLPSMPASSPDQTSRNLFNLLRQRVVALGMLGVSVFFMGQFALFTYLRPYLESVTGMNVAQITTVLLVIGGAGFIGTLMIGKAIKRNLYLTLYIIPLVMAAIALTLIAYGTWPAAVIGLLGCWGLVSTAAPVGWWAWLARTLPDNAEAGGGLMVAVIQLSIASGSTLGGLLFDWQGYQSTFFLSSTLLLIATSLIAIASRSEQK